MLGHLTAHPPRTVIRVRASVPRWEPGSLVRHPDARLHARVSTRVHPHGHGCTRKSNQATLASTASVSRLPLPSDLLAGLVCSLPLPPVPAATPPNPTHDTPDTHRHPLPSSNHDHPPSSHPSTTTTLFHPSHPPCAVRRPLFLLHSSLSIRLRRGLVLHPPPLLTTTEVPDLIDIDTHTDEPKLKRLPCLFRLHRHTDLCYASLLYFAIHTTPLSASQHPPLSRSSPRRSFFTTTAKPSRPALSLHTPEAIPLSFQTSSLPFLS